jgi:hypothetical protein
VSETVAKLAAKLAKLTFAPTTLQSKEKTAFCVAAANKRCLLFVMRKMLALRKQSITI